MEVMDLKHATDEVALQNQAGREKGKTVPQAVAEKQAIEARKAAKPKK